MCVPGGAGSCCFFLFLAGPPRVCGAVTVKRSEPIVVAHSGLADKQSAGTRGHPATITAQTALVWGQWVCRGEVGWGGHGATESRPTGIIGGRRERLFGLLSSVWHSDGPAANEPWC